MVVLYMLFNSIFRQHAHHKIDQSYEMRAFQKLVHCRGGNTYAADLRSHSGNGRGGIAFSRESISASSLSSAGRCSGEYLHLRTILRHATSLEMVFRPVVVDTQLEGLIEGSQVVALDYGAGVCGHI